jgi:hypothetical protein
MKLPAARKPRRRRAPRALRRAVLSVGALLVLLSLTPAAAVAADEAEHGAGGANTLDAADANAMPRVTVTRTDLELRNPSNESVSRQSLQPDSARLSDVNYRFWMSRGRADVGIGIGTLALTALPLGAVPSAAPASDLNNRTILLASAPSLSLGMRYRASSRSTLFADASGTRGLGLYDGDTYVGKVGVEWKPASLASRWNIAYGGVGWRLSADSRMTLRIRSGGFGLYMRSQF